MPLDNRKEIRMMWETHIYMLPRPKITNVCENSFSPWSVYPYAGISFSQFFFRTKYCVYFIFTVPISQKVDCIQIFEILFWKGIYRSRWSSFCFSTHFQVQNNSTFLKEHLPTQPETIFPGFDVIKMNCDHEPLFLTRKGFLYTSTKEYIKVLQPNHGHRCCIRY